MARVRLRFELHRCLLTQVRLGPLQATGRSLPGGSCYHQAVPIILFALLFFVLLAVAGVVLLSIALRYRAGTARRQGRRWVASLNVWMTSLSAVFFLSLS